MTTIYLRAYYREPSLTGSITISRIVGQTPVLYQVKGFDNNGNKAIPFKDVEFRTIAEAISEATKYGFLPDHWAIESKEG